MNLAESLFFLTLRRALAGVAFLLSAAQAFAQPALELTADEQAWLIAHPVIRMGVDPGYSPYTFFDNDGRPVGVASELTALVGRRTWRATGVGARLDLAPNIGGRA